MAHWASQVRRVCVRGFNSDAYLQVVSESAQPGRDGGQPPTGAVCAAVLIAAACGRTNRRSGLVLAGGSGTEETPQADPQHGHTHFVHVASGDSNEESGLCVCFYLFWTSTSHVVGQRRHEEDEAEPSLFTLVLNVRTLLTKK